MQQRQEPWLVEFHTDARGRTLSLEFLDSLQVKERAAITRVLDLLREHSPLVSSPYTRQVEGKLWELRAGAGRLFYFLHTGKRFIILHGYRKKTRKAPPKEIAIAKRRMSEYLQE